MNPFYSDSESKALSCFGSFVSDILAPTKMVYKSITFRVKISSLFMCQVSYVNTFNVLSRTSLSAHKAATIKKQISSKSVGLNQANIMRCFIICTLHMILLRLLRQPLNWSHEIVGIQLQDDGWNKFAHIFIWKISMEGTGE